MDGDDILVPSFRADLEHKADIAEEIARIHGYDLIPTREIAGVAHGALTEKQKFERETKRLLTAAGLNEVITFSFVGESSLDKIGVPTDSPLRRMVRIKNPLSEDMKVMRTTAVPSMLDVLTRNYNNRNAVAKLFEIATIYTPIEGEDLPHEHPVVSLGMYGSGIDFYDLKGVVDLLLDRLGVQEAEVVRNTENPTYHPGRCADLVVDGKRIGTFGEIHPDVLTRYGVDCRMYVAEIELDDLFDHRGAEKEYKPLPKFPATTRDLALVCDDDTTVSDLTHAIKSAIPASILERVELFDVYRGKQIESGKKSVAFNIVLRSADHTLVDEETEAVIRKVLKNLEAIGAVLR